MYTRYNSDKTPIIASACTRARTTWARTLRAIGPCCCCGGCDAAPRPRWVCWRLSGPHAGRGYGPIYVCKWVSHVCWGEGCSSHLSIDEQSYPPPKKQNMETQYSTHLTGDEHVGARGVEGGVVDGVGVRHAPHLHPGLARVPQPHLVVSGAASRCETRESCCCRVGS